MRRHRAALAAIAVLLSAACGSTVAPGSATQGAADPSLDAGSGLTPGAGAELGDPGTAGSAPGAAGAADGLGAGADSDGARSGLRLPTAGPASATGSGTTQDTGPGGAAAALPADSTITVGFFVQADGAAIAKSTGAENLQNGDEEAMAKALVEDLNARGGIAGRKVRGVYYLFDPANNGSTSTAQQAACELFKEEGASVALLGWHSYPDHALEECLQKRGILSINSSALLTGDAALLDRLPGYYAPPGLTLERQSRALVESLATQDFFGGGAKVGLVVLDTPEYKRAVDNALLPSLRARGVEVTADDMHYYPPAQSASDVGSQSSSIANAVLRFNSRGITRVMFLQLGVNGPFFFMQQAQQQRYFPRYALSTTDAPTALAPLAPAEQLRGAVGMGWGPVLDVPAAQEKQSAPARERCLDVLRERTGETFANRTVEYVGLSFCDSLWFFERVSSVAESLDTEGFRRAASGVGTAYQSPLVLSSDFGARRDGVAAYQNLQYVDSCGCFSYSGSARAIPKE